MTTPTRPSSFPRLARWSLWILPVLFIVAGFVVPVGAILSRSLGGFAGRPGLSADVVLDVLGDGRVWRLIRFTLWQTSLSVLFAVVLGVPIAWTLARLDFRGRGVLSAVATVPFVLPTIVVAGAFLALSPGEFAQRHPLVLIVAAHACFNLGVVVRTVGAFISTVPPEAEEVARSTGRGAVNAIWSTTIRSALPQIGSAALITGLFCLTSFGVIIGLGGASSTTLEVEIWYQTTRVLNLPVAAVLSLLQLLVVIVIISLQRRLTRTVTAGGHSGSRHAPVERHERHAVRFSTITVGLLIGAPLMALAVDSLRVGGTWTLANYAALGGLFEGTTQEVSPWAAIWTSLGFAAAATALTIAFSLPTVALVTRPGRRSRFLDRVVMLPLGASAATVGFGFLAAYSRGVFDLRGTWIAVPIVQAVVTIPIVVRALVPSVTSLDPALGEAAASCGGGSSRQILEIWWPLLRAPLGAALGLAIAVSLGEFGATAFVARSSRPTVPIVIAQLLGRPGASNFGAAMALSVILAVICAVLFAIIDRRGGGSVGNFG